MQSLLIRWFINAVAIGITARIMPGIGLDGDLTVLIIAALIFGLINAFLRPILTLLTCPLVLLTLGLFTLVINTFLLLLTARIVPGFSVEGFWAAFWASLVISLISGLLSLLINDDNRQRRHDDDVVIHPPRR